VPHSRSLLGRHRWGRHPSRRTAYLPATWKASTAKMNVKLLVNQLSAESCHGFAGTRQAATNRHRKKLSTRNNSARVKLSTIQIIMNKFCVVLSYGCKSSVLLAMHMQVVEEEIKVTLVQTLEWTRHVLPGQLCTQAHSRRCYSPAESC
jgi:hypothetical protein